MVVAYLRGSSILHKKHQFGRRSLISEEIVLESLNASEVSESMAAGVHIDLALLPKLREDAVRDTIRRVAARMNRASELRLCDVYKVGDQVSQKLKIANSKNELSLFQVYQIAEKTGIFEAFDEHYREEDSKPLL